MSIDKKDVIKSMLINVAEALGSDLLDSVAFLGGCATGLHVTDAATMNDIRMTDDVDLVVSAVGYSAWSTLQKTLRSRGFNFSGDARKASIGFMGWRLRLSCKTTKWKVTLANQTSYRAEPSYTSAQKQLTTAPISALYRKL